MSTHLYLYINLSCVRVVFPSFMEWWAIIKLARCAWAWWNMNWRDMICGTRSCTRRTRLISFYCLLFCVSTEFVCMWNLSLNRYFFARESAPENGSLRKDQDLALRKYKGLLAKQEQLLRGILSHIQRFIAFYRTAHVVILIYSSYIFHVNILELLFLGRFMFLMQTRFFSFSLKYLFTSCWTLPRTRERN